MLGVSVILPLVQVMLEPQQLKNSTLLGPILDVLNLDTNADLIWAVGAAVVIVYVFKNVFLF